MANLVKKALSSLLDNISSPAQVLAVRAWKSVTMYELDLHLPNVDMSKWVQIPRLKCRVDEDKILYRDYTPAKWDRSNRTCTLYIEAGHQGPGSSWIQRLRQGNDIYVGHAKPEKLPLDPGNVLCIGDGSALGHLLALKQMTSRLQHPLDGCVALQKESDIPQILINKNSDIEFCLTNDIQDTLSQWLHTRSIRNYSSIYLAGNIKLVTSLRQQLKAQAEMQARLYVQGFGNEPYEKVTIQMHQLKVEEVVIEIMNSIT
jgi:NADPH-dependent ferric siderophore reductase